MAGNRDRGILPQAFFPAPQSLALDVVTAILRVAIMMTLRYQTWRRSFPLGVVVIALCFACEIAFSERPWAMVFSFLFWAVIVASIVFNIAVGLLRKAGLLEFTYTDADRASYLYNMEKAQRAMIANRRARKRE